MKESDRFLPGRILSTDTADDAASLSADPDESDILR